MLLIDCTITEAAPKDTNLAEIVEIEKVRVQLASGGHEMRPVYGGVYVRGLPFGEQSPPVLAPVDLSAGDKLRVIADVETRAVWDVTRKGKVIWENKAVKDREDAAAAEKAAKRAVLDKLR
jgi:hypothetical protein